MSYFFIVPRGRKCEYRENIPIDKMTFLSIALFVHLEKPDLSMTDMIRRSRRHIGGKHQLLSAGNRRVAAVRFSRIRTKMQDSPRVVIDLLTSVKVVGSTKKCVVPSSIVL